MHQEGPYSFLSSGCCVGFLEKRTMWMIECVMQQSTEHKLLDKHKTLTPVSSPGLSVWSRFCLVLDEWGDESSQQGLFLIKLCIARPFPSLWRYPGSAFGNTCAEAYYLLSFRCKNRNTFSPYEGYYESTVETYPADDRVSFHRFSGSSNGAGCCF